jgi:hypothetical protein
MIPAFKRIEGNPLSRLQVTLEGVAVELAGLPTHGETGSSVWTVYLTELVNRHSSYRAGYLGSFRINIERPTGQQLVDALKESTLLDAYKGE